MNSHLRQLDDTVRCRRARPAAIALALVFAALVASGCRSLGDRGPVSKSVAEARLLSQRGMGAIERGDWKSAESIFSEAVTACPTDCVARRQYAEVLWQRGEREVALEHAAKALALSPGDMPLAVRIGEMELALGRIEAARESVGEVLDHAPHEPRAWALLGRVELARSQPEQALAAFQRAIEFCGDDRQLLLDTAELYRRLNRPQRALSTLLSLCETYGPGQEPQQVLYLQGLALAALARPADAADAFTLALERGPPSPEILYQLAVAEAAAGRPQEADRHLEQLLAMQPAHPSGRALQSHLRLAARPASGIFPQ